jgi:carbon monoxide dehydrogenase subunit G
VPRFEEIRTAHVPRDACWDLLTDVERTPEWLTIASRVRAAGPLEPGQTLEAHGGALGVKVELALAVVHLDPPARYGWRVTDPVSVDITFDLEEHDQVREATRLRATVDADLGRRLSVRVRLAVRVLRGEMARSLDQLVALSENAPRR